MGYTKLFNEIVTSTIWGEPHTVRIVWITMLALRSSKHIVETSIPGLAHTARVTIDECEEAIKILSSPDPYSRSKEFEGRRIEPIDGGFLILNGEKYRNKMNLEERQRYQRDWMRRKRAKEKEMNRDVDTPVDSVDSNFDKSTMLTQEKEKEKEKEKEYIERVKEDSSTRSVKKPSEPTDKKKKKVLSDEEWLLSIRNNPAYKHIDIDKELGKMDGWLSTRPARKKTRRFIVNWLNKVEVPVETTAKQSGVWDLKSGETI